MKKIRVCEDEAAIRDFVVINLTRAGYDLSLIHIQMCIRDRYQVQCSNESLSVRIF